MNQIRFPRINFVSLIILFCLFAQFVDAQARKKVSSVRSPENSVSQIQTDTPELRRAIKLKADEVSTSLLNCEYENMYELMHPKVREFVGGRDAFSKMVGEGIRSMEVEGFTILSIQNFEPEKIISINQELFAVVPTKLKVKTPQRNMIQSAYDLTISADNGKTWLFVGGSLGKESLEKLFPQIVGKITFPKPTLPIPAR